MRLLAYFESLVEPFPDAEPTAPPDRLWPFLLHYSRGMWPWLLLMSGLSALISILEVGLFAFLGNIVDWLDSAERTTFLSDEGWVLAGMAAVVVILLPLASFLQTVILHQTVAGNYPMRIRWFGHRYMLGQSYAFYQDEFAGRIATRLMQTSLAVRETVMKVLDVLVYVAVYFLGAMVLVATFNIWMTVPFLLWLVCYSALLRWFLPRLRDVSQEQADARSIMTGRVVDSYTNIMTVKLFSHTGREATYARESMTGFLGTVYGQMRLSSLLDGLLGLLNGLLLFGVAGIGIVLWVQGQSGVGALAVGVGLVLRLQGMSHWIMWELSGLFESIGVVYDGMHMLSKQRAVQDQPEATDLAVPKGRIEYDKVRFHYGKASGVMNQLSLSIEGGEKIGLVGRSGAGKTTLANLLLRLYDLEAGAIRIDGTDISRVRQESLRRHIGVVTQDSSLLHRSVFDNIAYGRPEADREAVIGAARRANAHDFIMDLEDSFGNRGYDAQVGERGVKLSGGQRQRIAIARMFLKDAPILVLDEATSALDSEVEAAIQENLTALMQGKTVIAIAHRLSTIAAMDRLVVLDDGRIVEEGTHQSLSTGSGLYAQLWSRQSGGFLYGDEAEVPADRAG